MKTGRILYGIWLAALAVLLTACSLEYQPILALGWGAVRATAIMLLFMLALLRTLSLADKAVPFRDRLRQFAAFAIAATLYWIYCFRLDGFISTDSTMDALVAGGLICAAAVFAEKGLFFP